MEFKLQGKAAERLVINTLFRRGLAPCLHGDWIASCPWRGWYLQVRKRNGWEGWSAEFL